MGPGHGLKSISTSHRVMGTRFPLSVVHAVCSQLREAKSSWRAPLRPLQVVFAVSAALVLALASGFGGTGGLTPAFGATATSPGTVQQHETAPQQTGYEPSGASSTSTSVPRTTVPPTTAPATTVPPTTVPAGAHVVVTKRLWEVNGWPAKAGQVVHPGDKLTYKIHEHNSGATAAEVTLTEHVPAGTTYTGAAAEAWTGCPPGAAAGTQCTKTVKVSATTTEHGSGSATYTSASGKSRTHRYHLRGMLTSSQTFTVTVDHQVPAGTTTIKNTVTAPGTNCALPTPGTPCSTSTPVTTMTPPPSTTVPPTTATTVPPTSTPPTTKPASATTMMPPATVDAPVPSTTVPHTTAPLTTMPHTALGTVAMPDQEATHPAQIMTDLGRPSANTGFGALLWSLFGGLSVLVGAASLAVAARRRRGSR